MIIYFIEGNISSGKSTVVSNLESLGYKVYQEPVDVWETRYVNKDGKNILQLFYEDMEKWSFHLEVIIMKTRFKRIQDAIQSNQEIVFIERSLLTDRHVFALNLKEQGKMDDLEWQIYIDWYDTFMGAIEYMLKPHDIRFLYIQTNPEVCHQRKEQRDRLAERTMVPEYLVQLHGKHEAWLLDEEMTHPVHTIDGNQSKDRVVKQIKDVITQHKNGTNHVNGVK